MAIHPNNTQTTEEPAAEAAVDQGGVRQWNFHAGSIFGAPISRTIGSEIFNKLKEQLSEIYKQTVDKNIEISLLDLDNVNEPALAYSSLIVAMRFKDRINAGVAYYIMLLESTGAELRPILDTINGQQVEIQRVASDAIDDRLLQKAAEKVKKAFPQGPWYLAEGVVVPARFNADDKYQVYQLALNAGLAVGTELQTRDPKWVDVNLAGMKHDSSLNVNIAFNRHQIIDAVGNPMRSDVLINFESKKINQQKYASVNSGDREVQISEISGFIDLAWNPVMQQSGFNPYVQQQMPYQQMMGMGPMTQKYAARLVITNLASNYSYTLGSVLLSLATTMALCDDNNWIQAFRPVSTPSNMIDLYDIGALNIEANLSNEPTGYGTRINTKSSDFRLEDLGQLVSALIRPGLVISMDVPEYGPQCWYLKVFASAARAGKNSQAAYRAIVEAANQLTNGRFNDHFKPGYPIFDTTDVNNRVHNGYWHDKDDKLRDIRDIDHLAVCNLQGDRNPQYIRDWDDTFYKTQFYPLEMRLSARKKMISSFTNDTAVFTGFSQRLTFTSGFMNALVRAIQDTGLMVRVNTPLTGSDFSNQRGIAGFVDSSLIQPGHSFMTPGYFNYQQQGPMYYGPSYAR